MELEHFSDKLELRDLTLAATTYATTGQSQEDDSGAFGTIDSMRGQEYSVGIFIFMVIGVLVFAAVIFRFVWSARKEGNGIRTGEKIMFTWIVLGTIVAVGFGALQLLQGQLF